MDESPNPNQPQILASEPQAEGSEHPKLRPAHPIRSLTRLVIGGVEVGIDELFRLLQIWEEEVELNKSAGPEAERSGSTWKEASKTNLRHALIGLIFETQDRVERETRILGQLGKVPDFSKFNSGEL